MNLVKKMSVCVFFMLTVYTLSGSSVVSGLRPPSPVQLTSFNMDLVLRWDPPEGEAGDLRYTAQYSTVLLAHRALGWRPVCVNTSLHECDLSHPKTPITVFGTYVGRVRTERGEERSDWGESANLTLDKHTIIGPPSVSLLSHRGNLDVSITDPHFSISSLRTVYNSPTYNITYWRDGQPEKAVSIPNIQQNLVVLDKLDPWTKYCVQVQIHVEMNVNPSRASRIVCETTANREEAPWVVAVVIFVFMAMVMTLIVLSVVYRKRISHFLCPKVSLPLHFEHLRAPLDSSMYLVMDDSQIPKEVCHPVTVVTHGTAEEERLLQADRTEAEEERHMQADRTEADVCHPVTVMTHGTAEEEHPLQADRTEAEEECPLNAAGSSCSKEQDIMEGEGLK
ncbi:interleukin-10 receptor subunit beta-like [Notolabrus celidotus]|uniref:interleukin-10 receptor subunit beta-like n=1 Tax=Notolabrus celidotus TaxID=1203425 RepID=UPI00148F9DAE|nr:interleukin-10 receptor subunit beta-like [Notolabrus celidotus]